MTSKPYSTNKNSPIIDKTTTFTSGWYRSINEKVKQLRNDLAGLRLRVASVKNNTYSEYQEMLGIPASYKRDFVFVPETQEVQIPAFIQTSGLSPYTVAVGDVPANFVVRSGQSYMIDLQIPGDGIFVAKYLSISLYQRVFDPVNGPQRIGMQNKILTMHGGLDTTLLTQACKFCISQGDSTQIAANDLGAGPNQRSLEYFWNMIDRSSGRKFSDALLSCNFLLPSTHFSNFNEGVEQGGPPKDGDIFDLGKPWIFERDSQIEIEFRPITDVFQLAASSAILPYTFDDREVNGTVRNNSVTVRAELHGAKFLTKQDALKYGARFFGQRENQELSAPGPGGNIVDENDNYGM